MYIFEVNGQKLESKEEKLVASDIIKMAQEKGILSSIKAENLILEVVGGKYKFKANDWVHFSQYNEFLLISNEPTPVA